MAYWLGSRLHHSAMPVLCVSHCKLDYRCVVYESAHHFVLRQLDPIHYQGLCIMSGAFHTSPAQSLYMEAHKVSHASCCLKLVLNYFLKLKSKLSTRKSSLQLAFFAPQNVTLLGTQHQNFHLWAFALLTRTVWFDLTKLKQHTTNPETYNQFYLQLTTEYPTSENLFTD